jgi:O-antigen/teichoic acid export membrane protein
MDTFLSKTTSKIRSYLREPFYTNSLYIALGRFLECGFGFLFWTLAARLYSVADVGIATALISSLGLVMAFSRLGFDTAIIRFMPSQDHSRVFNTCLWITTAAATVVGIIYLAAINLISPDIAFIRDYTPIFLLFVVVNSITLITGYALLSFRKADLKLIQNIIVGVRLLLLLPLTLLGSLGIFYSFGIAYLVATVFTLVVIRHYVTIVPKIDWEFTRKTISFSSQNYLANLFQNIPSLVMPILIVNLLSPENSALYYIAFTIGNLVLIIPEALATSFFVEGSHGTDLRTGVVKTLATIYVILIPAVLLIVLFGDLLLGLFGEDYIRAFNLLRIVAISSVFITIYKVFISIQNIRLQVRGIVFMNLIQFILLLGLSYVFLTFFGIIGVGYAWAITYLILSGGIVGFVKKRGWIG